jgi:hypothetical protein
MSPGLYFDDHPNRHSLSPTQQLPDDAEMTDPDSPTKRLFEELAEKRSSFNDNESPTKHLFDDFVKTQSEDCPTVSTASNIPSDEWPTSDASEMPSMDLFRSKVSGIDDEFIPAATSMFTNTEKDDAKNGSMTEQFKQLEVKDGKCLFHLTRALFIIFRRLAIE